MLCPSFASLRAYVSWVWASGLNGGSGSGLLSQRKTVRDALFPPSGSGRSEGQVEPRRALAGPILAIC